MLQLLSMKAVEEWRNDADRYYRYLHYKEKGRERGGLSPGQAYLEEKRVYGQRIYEHKHHCRIRTSSSGHIIDRAFVEI